MPRATQAIIIANVVVYLLQQLNPGATIWFVLWPLNTPAAFGPDAGFALWQLVTCERFLQFLITCAQHTTINGEFFIIKLGGIDFEPTRTKKAHEHS
jgi:hypothetical protein